MGIVRTRWIRATSVGATDGARRPVLVWLPGGGYSSGGGALDWYDGATLGGPGPPTRGRARP
jgi:carboxylesterase type B